MTNNRSGAGLALIPLAVAVLLGPLLLPMAAEPDEVPLPTVDARAQAHTREEDDARAAVAKREGLPGEVRVLGSAVREFRLREARDEEADRLRAARRAIDDALVAALQVGVQPVVTLRAVQMEAFLREVQAYEATGAASTELEALGGPFAARMARAGWTEGRRILLDDDERRVVFKLSWNTLVGVEAHSEFALTRDELRTLYRLDLRLPHASEPARAAIDAARRAATSKATCAQLDAGERIAIEAWRLDKINKLAAIDPDYPADYARGVSNYRRGNYPSSVESFRDWLRNHPDGPYALRARNALKAALDADRTSL